MVLGVHLSVLNSVFLDPPVWLYQSRWRPWINWVPLAHNLPDSSECRGVLFAAETHCLRGATLTSGMFAVEIVTPVPRI